MHALTLIHDYGFLYCLLILLLNNHLSYTDAMNMNKYYSTSRDHRDHEADGAVVDDGTGVVDGVE
jgi:hypothetical protein